MTWLLFASVLILIALAVLLALGLCRASGLASRGEDLTADDYYDTDDGPVDDCDCEDCDDLMAVADAVGDDHFAEDYALLNKVAPGLEGFTPLEVATLQRNYLPMTDDERFRLEMAWRSIVEGADR